MTKKRNMHAPLSSHGNGERITLVRSRSFGNEPSNPRRLLDWHHSVQVSSSQKARCELAPVQPVVQAPIMEAAYGDKAHTSSSL